MLWDYLVINAKSGLGNVLNPSRVAKRVATYYAEGVNLLVKYPFPLALPLSVKDSRNGLTRFADGAWAWIPTNHMAIEEASKVLPPGSRFGLYQPAPRADGPFPNSPQSWVAYARSMLALGVTDLFFDAQAADHPYDRFVIDCIREEGLAVHIEPYDAWENNTCQECSPLKPREGLELGIKRFEPGVSKYSEITALVTDVAPTREATLAYFRRWADLGCNVAVNVQGWAKQHGITAAELLGLMK